MNKASDDRCCYQQQSPRLSGAFLLKILAKGNSINHFMPLFKAAVEERFQFKIVFPGVLHMIK
jgi:hypothetical protein